MTPLLLVIVALLQVPDTASGSLRVTVLERGTDAGLAGVSIEFARVDDGNRDWKRVTTGPDGQVVINSLSPGTYQVVAQSRMHLRSDRPARLSSGIAYPPPPLPRGDEVVFDTSGGAYVRVTPRRERRVTIRLTPGGIISGTIVADSGSLADASVRLLVPSGRSVRGHPVISTQSTTGVAADGTFEFAGLPPGEYLVCVHPNRTRTFAFNCVYHPRAVDIENAEPIQIEPGARVRLSLELSRVPVVRISGRVEDPPAAGKRELIARRLDESRGDVIDYELLPLRGNGRFSTRMPSGIHGLLYTRRQADGELLAAATAVVHVADNAVDAVAVKAMPASSLTGHVVFGAEYEPRPPGVSPAIYLHPVGDDAWLRQGLLRGATADDDGSIAISGILGAYRIDARAPEGWIVEGVVMDGRNVLDKVVDFEPGKRYENVRLVVSPHAATIRGWIGGFAPEAGERSRVIAFPAEESLRQVQRYVRVADLDTEGRFALRGVTPGHSYLVALCEWPCYSTERDLEALSDRAERLFVSTASVFEVALRK